MQTTYPLPNGSSAVRKIALGGCRLHTLSKTEGQRFAKSRSADADCIPSPKRKVCGSQSSNRTQCRLHTLSTTEGLRFAKLQSKATQTAYPLQNGRFAVHKIALGRCRPHTPSQTEGQRYAKSCSADADRILPPKRKVSGTQNRARRMQHEVRSRFTPEHGEGVCFST